jgi:hypothetical protein
MRFSFRLLSGSSVYRPALGRYSLPFVPSDPALSSHVSRLRRSAAGCVFSLLPHGPLRVALYL